MFFNDLQETCVGTCAESDYTKRNYGQVLPQNPISLAKTIFRAQANDDLDQGWEHEAEER